MTTAASSLLSATVSVSSSSISPDFICGTRMEYRPLCPGNAGCATAASHRCPKNSTSKAVPSPMLDTAMDAKTRSSEGGSMSALFNCISNEKTARGRSSHRTKKVTATDTTVAIGTTPSAASHHSMTGAYISAPAPLAVAS